MNDMQFDEVKSNFMTVFSGEPDFQVAPAAQHPGPGNYILSFTFKGHFSSERLETLCRGHGASRPKNLEVEAQNNGYCVVTISWG
jgi:hypothetical protein